MVKLKLPLLKIFPFKHRYLANKGEQTGGENGWNGLSGLLSPGVPLMVKESHQQRAADMFTVKDMDMPQPIPLKRQPKNP
jgi:hypothetical protein